MISTGIFFCIKNICLGNFNWWGLVKTFLDTWESIEFDEHVGGPSGF